ncbi:MAG: phosphate ABC transporter ATP-binding protein PstB [Thermodesulfobacteriota bacterium]
MREDFKPADNTSFDSIIAEAKDVSLLYGETPALKSVSMRVPANMATALIGPSGCGKSTFLRCFNRMNDLIDDVSITGEIEVSGSNIYSQEMDVSDLRRRVGMVFQKSNPFPSSIYENVAYGPRIAGMSNRNDLDEIVESSLKQAGLWKEARDRLKESAFALSGGQQQRLCIARAIAVRPELLLMDEPCSALDPIATASIEDLIRELKREYTVIIVTHNMQQAARVSDYTMFMYLGSMIEYDETEKIFLNPSVKETEDYVSGKFG